MTELLARVAVVALTILSYIFDFITFPIYVIIQRPFARRKYSLRIRVSTVSLSVMLMFLCSFDDDKSWKFFFNPKHLF